MVSTSPNAVLTQLDPTQGGADVTVNRYLAALEKLPVISVVSGVTTSNPTPPATPAAGSAYYVGTSPTAPWTGQAGKIAFYIQGGSGTPAPEVFITKYRGMLFEDQVSGRWYRWNGAAFKEIFVQSRSFRIASPGTAENAFMFWEKDAGTIFSLNFNIQGTGGPALTVLINKGTDRSAAGTAVVTAGTLVNNTTTGQEVTSFNSASIPAGSYVWLTTNATGAAGTTRTELCVTVRFTYDA